MLGGFGFQHFDLPQDQPSNPKWRYRPAFEEAWMDWSGWISPQEAARWEHPERQFPENWVHPTPHLHSYPLIDMESIKSFWLRCHAPGAHSSEILRFAAESDLDWIKRYPKIDGDTLSEEQKSDACGILSLS